MAESELPNDLRLWIEETADGRLIQATRRPGGARREAWYVDIEKKNGEVEELFLRLDRSLEKKQQPKEDWWEDGSTGAVGAWVTSIER